MAGREQQKPNEGAAHLVAFCFAARTAAHFAHLKSVGKGSYARHKALNEYYEGIVDLGDKFAEAYQGRFELIMNYPTVPELNDDEPLRMVKGLRKWIDDNRNACTNGVSELENIVDEIQDLNDSTVYKLQFLE